MGNPEHNMPGLTGRRDRTESNMIRKEEKTIPRDKKIGMAKETMEEKFRTEDGLALKKIAQELLQRHENNISVINNLTDNELEKEAGKYATADELVGACEWIVDEQKKKEDTKWDKYKDF